MRGNTLRSVALVVSILLAPAGLLALDPSRQLQQYVHDVWKTDQGLPQATVSAISQTGDGYLWLGTEEGLARFDGVRFTVFNRRHVPALRANRVLSLRADHGGGLWIGTHGGGLVRYEAGAFKALSDRRTEFVYALHEARDRALWVGGRLGVAILRDGRFTSDEPQNVPSKTIWSILEDRDGALWIGTDLHGLFRIAGGTATAYNIENGKLASRAVTAIVQLKDGRIVAGSNGNGLFEWTGERFVPFQATGTLPSPTVNALLEDRDGNLWVGTRRGLARARDGVIATGAPDLLGRAQVLSIAEDREGNLWLGTAHHGLHRLRNGNVLNITPATGLAGERAQVVYHDRSGAAWIGTYDGLTRIQDGQIATWTVNEGLPNNSVRSLFQSDDGAMWIGTERGGVVRMVAGRMETTILDPGIPDNTVRAFAEQPGAGVWAGTNGGPLSLFRNGRRDESVRLGESVFVRAMSVAVDGSLWVATDGSGLLHITANGTRTYTVREGLSWPSIRSLYTDSNGTVWVGTDGGGLNRLRDGKVTVYNTGNGLFDDVVLQIIEGDDGRLWMSCNLGVFAVEKRELEAVAAGKASRVRSIFFDEHDGMVSRDCYGGSQPAGSKDREGRLWFPTIAGVAIIDPQRISTNHMPPPVWIEEVFADRKRVAGPDSFALPLGTKNLEIAFTAPSLVVPERVRFRYRLEGYDEGWVDAGSRRTAYYTNLPPGRYRFQVIAANEDGIWNRTGAGVVISQPGYLYQRSWFRWLAALAGAALIAVVILWRVRFRRAQKARDAEVERRLALAERMEALGHMASGIAHDFNNTLMSASPWAEMIRRKYAQDPLLKQAADNILLAVDRGKKVTRRLLDFAQPKPPETAVVDLGQLVRDELTMARSVIAPEIHLEARVEPGPLQSVGDRAQLGRVIMNLLLNARDATQSGGRITVEARTLTPREAGQWGVDPQGMLLLAVSDDGAGMDAEVAARIFDPFFTTKGVGKGTGLGLAVVHRVVHDHNGVVLVDSAPGQGTTFSILLPRALATAPPTAAIPESRNEALTGKTVLIIDDEEAVAEGISDLLSMEGMSVSIAGTGQEGLRRIDDGYRPDVIILDLGLPEMSGDRVFPLLRNSLPDVPVLISSGYGDRERLDAILAFPRTAYVQKPYEYEELMQCLRELLAA